MLPAVDVLRAALGSCAARAVRLAHAVRRRLQQRVATELCDAFGLLAVNGLLLFLARKAILTKTPTPLSNAIYFLYREFEPWAFWWELVEMLRRVVLVGLSSMLVTKKIRSNAPCTITL